MSYTKQDFMNEWYAKDEAFRNELELLDIQCNSYKEFFLAAQDKKKYGVADRWLDKYREACAIYNAIHSDYETFLEGEVE